MDGHIKYTLKFFACALSISCMALIGVLTFSLLLPPPGDVRQYELPIATLKNEIKNPSRNHLYKTWNITKMVYTNTDFDGNVMVAIYPQGSYIPSGDIKGGFNFYAQPTVFPRTSATLKYSVWFPNDFDWVKGGKLPGLWIGQIGASGGHHIHNGYSCRIMWRTNGQAESYLYVPQQLTKFYNKTIHVNNNDFGDSLWRGVFQFHKSSWNNISIGIKLNDIGANNGLLSIAINNVSMSYGDMIWREENLMINGLMMHTFFGGNDPSWATPKVQQVRFKDFVVTW
jgi:hypothetical protein